MIEPKGTHRVSFSVGTGKEDLEEMMADLSQAVHYMHECKGDDLAFYFDNHYRLLGFIKGGQPPYIMLKLEEGSLTANDLLFL